MLTATPAAVPMVVLARLVEVNGRPVSVVFAGAGTDLPSLVTGDLLELTPALLAQSVNVWEAMTGVAYPLLYTSTTAELRDVFRAAARTARQNLQGVWAQDSSASFPVTDLAAIGPDGALVWPKLFRRVVDYLRQRAAGQTLPDWLAAAPLQDDDLYLTPATEGTPVALHTVLQQTGQQVVFPADPIEVTVVER